MDKRDFLKVSGAVAAAAVISPPVFAANTEIFGLKNTVGSSGQYVLPKLNYAYDSLEPHIDTQTMTLHHSLHHQGYVNGLNNATKKVKEATESGDFSIIKHWSRELAFHGGGHFLHSIYWNVMSPKTSKPSRQLEQYINRSFGSMDNFKKLYKAAALSVEGSGWGIMSYEPYADRLVIMQIEKQGDLSQWVTVPILPVDVWEHSYYLKYQNRRGEYLDAFFNIINWDYISEQFAIVLKMYGK